jgi:hypothetical protein
MQAWQTLIKSLTADQLQCILPLAVLTWLIHHMPSTCNVRYRMLVQHDASLAASALRSTTLQRRAQQAKACLALFRPVGEAQPGPGNLRPGGPRYEGSATDACTCASPLSLCLYATGSMQMASHSTWNVGPFMQLSCSYGP